MKSRYLYNTVVFSWGRVLKKIFFLPFFTFFISITVCHNALAEKVIDTFTGVVISALDGNSFSMVTAEGRRYLVDIAYVDTPEMPQIYGLYAQLYLSLRIRDKTVLVQVFRIDHYGKITGRVWLEDEDIGLSIIAWGLGWHYTKHPWPPNNKDRVAYTSAEQSARQMRRGLWWFAEDEAIPPYHWRQGTTPPLPLPPRPAGKK